jgi:hypothetical protein
MSVVIDSKRMKGNVGSRALIVSRMPDSTVAADPLTRTIHFMSKKRLAIWTSASGACAAGT